MAIWSILLPFGLFCGYLVYFVVIWYMHFLVIGFIFPVLVCYMKKNLATLAGVSSVPQCSFVDVRFVERQNVEIEIVEFER
jgi:hypothetical protein